MANLANDPSAGAVHTNPEQPAGGVDALLDGLTPEQRQAVVTIDGPLLILAGAGSGKTRVLTRRVAYLVAQGIDPAGVLAITFTNKAAGEMRARVGDLLGRPLRDWGRLDGPRPQSTVCTFHSLCLRVLRHYGDILGVPARFHIFDTGEQSKLVKQAISDVGLSTTNFPAGAILGTISNAKNALTDAHAYAAAATDFYERQVAKVFLRYTKLLADNDALDFDDLILRTVSGLRTRPDVLAELQDRFQYLHIDEYQDTNRAQYLLAHVLAARHRNLCVVGDPDQSIYAWRGADLRNILDFEKDYPDAAVVKLERNYRSTRTILSAADALIRHNVERKDKRLLADRQGGGPIRVVVCPDEHDEARQVASWLVDLQATGKADWSDMAVFYRMNSLSRVLEDALRREKVPYQIARGVEFYNRKEIKDALAYLRVVSNPRDEVSLNRIVNMPPRGLGATTMKAIESYAAANGLGLWEGMKRADDVATLTARAKSAAARFVGQVQDWQHLSGSAPTRGGSMFDAPGTVQRLLETVVRESGLEEHFRKNGGEEQAELQNVGELMSAAAEFDRVAEESSEQGQALVAFLHGIALVSDTDQVRTGGGAVTLMTLHAAKGLEFPVVAVVGWEEGCLPHSRARDSLRELEEERRLAFVGITRAMERLTLSRAKERTIRGQRERVAESPFLREIFADIPAHDLEVVDRTGVPGFDRAGRNEQQWSLATTGDRLAGRFRPGQKVLHPTFGTGLIAELVGGSSAKAVIDFDRAGRKTLMLEIAGPKLTPIG